MEEAKYQQHVQHLQGGVVGDGNNTTIHYHGTAGSPSVPHTPVPTTAWNVPFHRNPFFIGRDDLLKQLHNQLTTGTATALTQAHAINGLGGIGKTQMAVEYAYRYRETYPFVFWVRAENRETLITDLVGLASFLQVEGYNNPDQNKVIAVLKHWLTTHTGWLLIFDNADEPHLLTDVLPSSGPGHVLLTTRASHTQPIAEPLEVEQMEEDLGVLFLSTPSAAAPARCSS